VVDVLGVHFRASRRALYLEEAMPVVYPGAPGFIPDVLAVVGVEQPEDDERMAWVVTQEGRGLDLVIEVLHMGNRKKDLEENVERYALLGIPEYFIYDCGRRHLHGHRLPGPAARRYQPIIPRLGRYTSQVLGLDLVVRGGKLRFFSGVADLPGSEDLIERLQAMVADLEAKADDAQAKADEAEAKIDEAKAKADEAQAKADEAKAKADEAQAKADEEAARADLALNALRESIAGLLASRGVPCSDAARARLSSCRDAAELQRWLLAAVTATAAEDVFGAA
jgi:hypothetical protein